MHPEASCEVPAGQQARARGLELFLSRYLVWGILSSFKRCSTKVLHPLVIALL